MTLNIDLKLVRTKCPDCGNTRERIVAVPITHSLETIKANYGICSVCGQKTKVEVQNNLNSKYRFYLNNSGIENDFIRQSLEMNGLRTLDYDILNSTLIVHLSALKDAGFKGKIRIIGPEDRKELIYLVSDVGLHGPFFRSERSRIGPREIVREERADR